MHKHTHKHMNKHTHTRAHTHTHAQTYGSVRASELSGKRNVMLGPLPASKGGPISDSPKCACLEQFLILHCHLQSRYSTVKILHCHPQSRYSTVKILHCQDTPLPP